MRTNKAWSKEQLDWAREAYTRLTLVEMAPAFNAHFGLNATENQMRAMTRNHKMLSGRTGYFNKGQQPWNTGKSGYMGANTTSFKPGNRPASWVAVGTERRCSKDNYIKIKVAEPNKWKFKHRMIWEEANGPVPKGMVLIFRDGDKDHCELENLELISRAVLAQYNKRQGHSYAKELRVAVRTLAAIQIESNRRLQG